MSYTMLKERGNVRWEYVQGKCLSFQIIPRPMRRLGLGLGSGPHVVVGEVQDPESWDGYDQEYGLMPVFKFSLKLPGGMS